jgi:very-short-patch-repair endonuclease
MDNGGLQVALTVAEHVSIAFHQNAIPVIGEIRLDNQGGADLADVVLEVTTEPAFTQPLVVRIAAIAAGGQHHVTAPNPSLDAAVLRRLTEGVTGDVRVVVTADGVERGRADAPVRLMPPSHWGGSGASPELLAAFVRPNDPVIDTLLHDAAGRLAAAGRPAGIDGYETGRRERVWDIAAAIWSAVAAHGITYVLPPASFERTGQKVRFPADILDRKTGTCFDLSLLFAAVFEQAGLRPVVVLTEGHAFVGLWLRPDGFSAGTVDDLQTLRKRRDLDDLIFIETTLVTAPQPARFADAVKAGAAQVDETAARRLDVAVDIARARAAQIRPLDLGDATAAPVRTAPEAPAVDLGLDVTPVFADDVAIREAVADEPTDRMEKWKRRLLDLTLRNKLLNFKEGRKSIGLECPDPTRLEDLLAAGTRFRILPRAEALGPEDVRDPDRFRDRAAEDGRRATLLTALEAGTLHALVPEKDLDERLTDLYRMARTAFEEGGANVLFLAFGFLKWTQRVGSAPLKAPLLLIPVMLQRSSMRAGFRLALNEDDARFNPTLLQLLRQDFRLAIPELEKDLPIDEAGLDVGRIWRIVREVVREMRGWEVTPEVVLSTFSFTKFLMWRDLVERMAVLKRNPVVAHLVDTPTEGYGDPDGFPDPARLDVEHHPREIFAPLPADSSQLAAVLAAAGGRDFVLFGPPGTGKSQTIANMISQCLALGRTVLFVSQKTAALEVVQRRLRDIGLGDYCLEVHSAKSQKSAVLEQLKTAWHERTRPTVDDWGRSADELAAQRAELNRLVDSLSRRHANGLTAYEAFGRVIANRTWCPELALSWPGDGPDRARLADLRRQCADLGMLVRATGPVGDHPLAGVDHEDWSPAWRRDLEAALGGAIDALTALDGALADLAAVLGLEPVGPLATVRALLSLAVLLTSREAAAGAALLAAPLAEISDAIGDLERLQRRHGERAAALAGAYRPSVLGEDLRRLLADWSEAAAANFLVRSSRKQKVRLRLEPFATGALPDDIGRDLAALIEMADDLAGLTALGERLAAVRLAWDGLATPTAELKALVVWAERCRRVAAAIAPAFGTTPDVLLDWIGRLVGAEADRLAPGGAIARAQTTGLAAWTAAQQAIAAVSRLTRPTAGDAPPFDGDGWIADTVGLYRRWLGGLNRAPEWCQLVAGLRQAGTAGLAPLAAEVAAGRLDAGAIERALDVAHARWFADRVVETDATLRTFLVDRHEDAIARFRRLDARLADLSRQMVRARLADDIPGPSAFGRDPEYGLLARELVKKTRHLPLRKLFGAIPNVLPRLTPCVMMSPLSIAQYLPADSRPFDVVIFDEASQIPVWDAIGAIARGRQVVIAGDPEQLPPTSVGERGIDEAEDTDDVEDQDSILSECIASNIPYRRLTWHYRSRHESLIAFSNRHYYQGKLVTFPSPVTEDRAVRYVPVPGGVYERGSGRVNREEARVVVADVVRRLADPAFARDGRSLGIVTFNGEQCRLIENLLDAERRRDPALERFFDDKRWHEPVFVKNLENVQGDERDTILFSVAVAADDAGRVSTISSLNKDGGYRRLNVAITRARREMVVFATLRPDQIDLSRTRARAVRDFKHFLEYAARGSRALAEASAPTGGDVESPFEAAVKRALEARGWTVQPQIGVSGFRIDLGVVHPDAPGRYLAGVECDGATYHSAATARDRDRLREIVLNGLGWRIRRVWSTDWWMDAERATDRLDHHLRADLDADRAKVAAEAEAAAAAEAAATAAAEVTGAAANGDAANEAAGETAAAVAAETAGVGAEGSTNGAGVREAATTDEGGDVAGAGGIVAADARAEQGAPSIAVPPGARHAAAAEARSSHDGSIRDGWDGDGLARGGVVQEGPTDAGAIGGGTDGRESEGAGSDADESDGAGPDAGAPAGAAAGGRAYRVADLVALGHAPDPDRFYDLDYRRALRAMVAAVVAVEGPLYEDVLVQRIARAHGFQRAGGVIRETVLGALVPEVPRSLDDGRTLCWPAGADPAALVPFRDGEPGDRAYGDIPLVELASLARSFRADGADAAECGRRIANRIGMTAIREATRARFERAIALAEARSAPGGAPEAAGRTP